LQAAAAIKELHDYRSKAKKELKILKEHVGELREEKVYYVEAIESLRGFFEKVNLAY
jgi:hypothetical protein